MFSVLTNPNDKLEYPGRKVANATCRNINNIFRRLELPTTATKPFPFTPVAVATVAGEQGFTALAILTNCKMASSTFVIVRYYPI
jgi:hypothetical protein